MIHKNVTNTCRQTIKTKDLNPTDTKGARIKASASGSGNKETVTTHYDYEISRSENHDHAASMLLSKMGWSARHRLIGGAVSDGYVYVAVNREVSS